MFMWVAASEFRTARLPSPQGAEDAAALPLVLRVSADPQIKEAPVLRQVLLSASRSPRLRHVVETAPLSKQVVARYVAGTTAADAVRVTGGLLGDGRTVSVDHPANTLDRTQAEGIRDARWCSSSSPAWPTAPGLGEAVSSRAGTPGDGEKIAYDNATRFAMPPRRLADRPLARKTTPR
jgi:hypothetical protein